MDLGFVKGEYSLKVARDRPYYKTVWVLGVFKGQELVGMVCWHPKAKQMVFNSNKAITEPLMRFVMPYMNTHIFHTTIRCSVNKFKG